MAEANFDRGAFMAGLRTSHLGRSLATHAEASSTNDLAWDAHAAAAPAGFTVVADAQTLGRGRLGRVWHTAAGKGLALSVLLHARPDSTLTAIPLAAGLALARSFDALGVPAQLKWPNDLLLGERKVAGVLVESRTGVKDAFADSGSIAIVIGLGVNVSQAGADFPAELRDGGRAATSLAIAGHRASREALAAEFLNALEPLVHDLASGDARPALAAWRERAAFWNETVRVLTPSGPLVGIARGLDDEGRLVLELEHGERVAIAAGDVEVPRGAASLRP